MARTVITIDGVGYELEEANYLAGKYAIRLSTGEREFLDFSQIARARFYGEVEDDD